MWCMKATWSPSANGISLSLSSFSRLVWKRLSRSSLGRQWELFICCSFPIAEHKKANVHIRKLPGQINPYAFFNFIIISKRIDACCRTQMEVRCIKISEPSYTVRYVLYIPVLNVTKNSSTCWHFGSSLMRSNWKGTMWMLSSETRCSPAHTHNGKSSIITFSHEQKPENHIRWAIKAFNVSSFSLMFE